jgi:Mg-chelatase subunit ChlD
MKRALSLVALLVLTAVTLGQAQTQTPLVQLAQPQDGAVVTAPVVTVTGHAELPARPPATFDVVLVIDTSGSTRMPAALGDSPIPGILIGPFDKPGGGPSILEAELTGARRFVEVADRASTRIGVVTFSESIGGRPPGNAWVEQPLTTDYQAVGRTLDRVRQRGPNGGTDMAAGLRLAIQELHALQGATSQARPGARKVVLFLTDGYPTLPYPSPSRLDPRNVGATLDVARLAARGDIVVHTFCLGPEALAAPVVCRDAARITGGTYQPVQRAADVMELLPATRIGDVEVVSVRNATTGQLARRLEMDATGRFSAEVLLAPGANRLVAQVQGAAPGPGMATAIVHYRPAGAVDSKVEPPAPRRDPEVDIRIERGPPRR